MNTPGFLSRSSARPHRGLAASLRSHTTRRGLGSLGLLLLFLSGGSTLLAREIPFLGTRVEDGFPGAFGVSAIDVDQDGDMDVLGAATGSVGIIWVENTNGDGSAWTRHNVDSNFSGAFAVTGADIDGDGDNDLLGAANFDNDVTWWENTAGDGSTWTRHDIDTTFSGAADVAAADLDGDGDLDVVAAGSFADDVTWWENTAGDGSTWTEHTIDGTFDGARGVFVSDLDGDGDNDVIATGEFESTVTWFENTSGDGLNWNPQVIDNSAPGGIDVWAGDVDGDGDLDVLAAAEGANEIAWYENNGPASLHGAFLATLSWTEHQVDNSFVGAHGVFGADLDLDGDTDFLGAARNDNDVTWWENLDGEGGSFQKRTIAGAFTSARSVFATDLDSDGDFDVLSAALNLTEISWWENETLHRSATYPSENLLDSTFGGARSIAAGDLDGDGDNDIAGLAFDDDEVAWWENTNGDGSVWTKRIIPGTYDGARSIEVVDIDRDGDNDLLTSAENIDDISWWENVAGDGSTWTKNTIRNDFPQVKRAVAADVDGDGDPDVMGASLIAKDITWFANDGDGGTWTPTIIEDNFDRANSVFGADIDGDGDIDAIGSADTSDDIAWWENTSGDGSTWSAIHIIDPFYSGASYVSAADVEGDGDLDVLGAAEGADEVTWWENDNGDGSSWTKHTISFINQATSILGVDLDNDGDTDILGTGFKDGGKLHWWENIGGSGLNWAEHVITDFFDGANWVDAADMDGDGDLDIMATAQMDNDIAYWANRGGQFGLATELIADGNLGNGVTEGLLDIVTTHHGLVGEQDIELATLELLFEETPGVPLTTSEANSIFANLFVYRDDGDGTFDAGLDILVTTVATFALTDGVQTVTFVDGDSDVQVAQGTPRRFFVAVETTGDYDSQPVASFRITHVTESSSSAEDRDHDIPLTLEFVANVTSSLIPVNTNTPVVDLLVTMSDSPDPVDAGNNLTYTVTVQNNGPVAADDVEVNTTLPGGVLFSSTTGCNEDPAGVPSCSLGTIGNGNSKVFTIQVSVDPGTSGTINATSTVTSSAIDNNPANDTANEETTVNAAANSADLSVAISDSPDPVAAGGNLTYTLTVDNAGPDTAENVVLTTTLPGEVSFPSTSGCNQDPNGTPSCNLGNLAPGSTQVTLTVTVNGDASGPLTLQASVAATTSDPDNGNNSDSEQTTVTSTPTADLDVVKTAFPSGHEPGIELTYWITITNHGPNDADGSTVNDTFPGDLSGVIWTCSGQGGATCGNPNGAVNISGELVDLPVGGSVTFRAVGTVSGGGGTITNTASAAVPVGVDDPVAANNSDSASTAPDDLIFFDDFESGDFSGWSNVSP